MLEQSIHHDVRHRSKWPVCPRIFCVITVKTICGALKSFHLYGIEEQGNNHASKPDATASCPTGWQHLCCFHGQWGSFHLLRLLHSKGKWPVKDPLSNQRVLEDQDTEDTELLLKSSSFLCYIGHKAWGKRGWAMAWVQEKSFFFFFWHIVKLTSKQVS